jgi:hypothetical protein
LPGVEQIETFEASSHLIEPRLQRWHLGGALSWACRLRLSSFQRFAPFERLPGTDFR